MDGKDPCPCINLNRVHRFNLNIKIMKKIFKINSDNHAGLVQEFNLMWNGVKSGLSDRYPNMQTESIDLKTLIIPDSAEIWMEFNVPNFIY